MATEEVTANRREVVIRVHGTGAARISDSGDAWWQSGSQVEAALASHLKDIVNLEHYPFHWSGANTESARQTAATMLTAKIASLEQDSMAYHLIGHSHGGSVIWMALRAFCQKGQSLPGLKSWITVGTPYLHYRPKPVSLLDFLPLVVFAVVAFPTALWSRFSATPLLMTVIDSYTYRSEIAFHHGQFMLIALNLLVFVMTTLCLISVFELGMALYRTVSFTNAQELNRRAFATFQERGLVLWTPEDEAINGLASTLGLSGDIIPRMTRGQGNWRKRAIDSLLFPLRTVFNLVFAPAADMFIWQSVTDRLQGSDIHGRELAQVSNSPCPDAGGWSALETSIGERLLDHANTFASATLSRMRAALGLASEGGHHRPNILVGLRSQLTLDELIHTSYFGEPDVLAIIFGRIAGVRDEQFKNSSLYRASDGGGNRKSLIPLVSRKRVSLFPLASAAGLVALFAFLSLLAQTYVVPHTRKNFQSLALTQGGRVADRSWINNISGTHHWIQALVFSGRSDLAIAYAQHAPDNGTKTDGYLCLALAYAQVDDLRGIESALKKIRELPKATPGGWANNLNFVLRTLVEEQHFETARALAIETAAFSERIPAPFSRSGELANLARSLARIGEKTSVRHYAVEARQIIETNHIDNPMILGDLVEAFYLIGDVSDGREAAAKWLESEKEFRSEYIGQIYEAALRASDRDTAQEIMSRLIQSSATPAAPGSRYEPVQTTGRKQAKEIGEKDLPLFAKIYAVSIIQRVKAEDLQRQIPGHWLFKFTNLAAIELARRGAVGQAIEVSNSYTLLGANHLMVSALARALVPRGYTDAAIAEATQVENAGQRGSQLALVALALSEVQSCSRVPSLIDQSESAIKAYRFADATNWVKEIIEQGRALASCNLLPEARSKLRDATARLDELNDPSKRIDLMADLNKAFVQQASYSDSLDIARRAFTPQNELDIFSDALLEDALVQHPHLKKTFKPLWHDTIYVM